MICHATLLLANFLGEMDIPHLVTEEGTGSRIRIPIYIRGEHKGTILAISDGEGNDVAIVGEGFFPPIPPEKRSTVLELFREAELRYRCYRFRLDSGGNLTARYDLSRAVPDWALGNVFHELITCLHDILEELVPTLNRALEGYFTYGTSE